MVGSEDDLNAVFNEGAPLTEEDRKGLEPPPQRAHRLLHRQRQVRPRRQGRRSGARLRAPLRRQRSSTPGPTSPGSPSCSAPRPRRSTRTLAGLASQEGFEFLAAAVAGKWIVADFSTLEGPVRGAGQAVRRTRTGGVDPGPDRRPPGRPGPVQGLQGRHRQGAHRGRRHREAGVRRRRRPLPRPRSRRCGASTPRCVPVSSSSNGPAALRQEPAPRQRRPRQAGFARRVGQGRTGVTASSSTWPSSADPPAERRAGGAPARHRPGRRLRSPPRPTPCTVDIAGLIQQFFSQFGQLLEGVGAGLSNYD